jgi:hypothetical protein
VGSKTFDGVRFMAYPADHDPPHVHATTAGVIVVLALLGDGGVGLADRKDAISPGNAPRNVVARILRVAAANVDELWALWEKVHGTR